MRYKILAKEWRSALHTVGFIAYATNNPANPGEWNSVVGYVPNKVTLGVCEDQPIEVPLGGESEDFDAQCIAANGAKIEWNVAKELFPMLDITKHKYYPTRKEGDTYVNNT